MQQIFDTRVRQRGAALIVSLVLMMVLTLLAVSTMRTSTLELAMAGNAQFHQQAVELAETGIQDAVSRINNNIIRPNPSATWLANFSENVQTLEGGNLGQYDVTIIFKHRGNAPGDSEGIKADYYEIESTGKSAARNAKSTLRQGFFLRVTT